MNKYDFQFESEVDIYDFGRMAYTVIYAPKKLLRQLPLKQNPRLRIDGVVAGVPYQGAFQPAGQGKYYLILSRRFCKSAGLERGDVAVVGFNVADQNAVDVPSELEYALDANQRAREIWNSISAGKKRGLAYRVSSAQRAATKENRVEEVLETLLEIGKKAK